MITGSFLKWKALIACPNHIWHCGLAADEIFAIFAINEKLTEPASLIRAPAMPPKKKKKDDGPVEEVCPEGMDPDYFALTQVRPPIPFPSRHTPHVYLAPLTTTRF